MKTLNFDLQHHFVANTWVGVTCQHLCDKHLFPDRGINNKSDFHQQEFEIISKSTSIPPNS